MATMTVQLCRVDPGVDPIKIIEEHEEATADIYEAAYGHLETWPKDPVAGVRAQLDALNARIGLTDGYLDCVAPIPKTPSSKHPDHPFRIDYWFSGPSPRSLNNTLNRHTGDDLTNVFKGWANFYEKPDWDEVVLETQRIRARLVEAYHGVDVHEVSQNPFLSSPVSSSAEALDVYVQQERNLDRRPDGVTASFFEEPLKLLAAIQGTATLEAGQPATFLVHEWTPEHLQWYCDALDIIGEQAKFAAEHEDRENLILRWNSCAGLEVYE